MTKPSPSFRAAIDYGPLGLFFVVNFLAPAALLVRLVSGMSDVLVGLPADQATTIARVIVATAVFMVATAAAMVASHVRLGRVAPMLWISGGLVLVFGALTIWFRDPRFLQVKPTIVYAMLAGVLAFGLFTGRPLLQSLLESAYPGLRAEGWRKLTRNWALFFVGMAIANEAVWRTTSWNFWVGYKVWGAIPLTLLFAIANVPMLMRNGLQTEAPVPPEG
jgi:intracellular septation protein